MRDGGKQRAKMYRLNLKENNICNKDGHPKAALALKGEMGAH